MTQWIGQMNFKRIETVKNAMVKGLLTQLIPKMFDRVLFG